MRSYIWFQGTQTSLTAICEDVKTNDNASLDDWMVYSYVNALKKIFVVEDMLACGIPIFGLKRQSVPMIRAILLIRLLLWQLLGWGLRI